MKGKFVTIEGCEGSGKSTQVELLKEHLAARSGREVLFVREPGGTKLGEALRDIVKGKYGEIEPVSELMLFAAARVQLVEAVIRPAVMRGAIVVCDRFVDSTVAYQQYGRGLDPRIVGSICDIATNGLAISRTIFLDISPQDAFVRKGGQDKDDRLEQAGLEFHQRVYQGYKELAKRHPQRIVSIDAKPSAQEVLEQVMDTILSLSADK